MIYWVAFLVSAASYTDVANAFVVAPSGTFSSASTSICASVTTTSTNLFGVALDKISDVVYKVQGVKKPMGVIFGENSPPFGGLVVNDVEPGLSGGVAGLRKGDQLVAVNGQSVLGLDFDSALQTVIQSKDPIPELQLFRGNAQQLWTIVMNRDAVDSDEEGAYGMFLQGEEQIVMDETYEAPVIVQVNEEESLDDDKPLTASDVFNAFKKIGQTIAGTGQEGAKEKKKGGLFGAMFGGETVQLEGDDASTLK